MKTISEALVGLIKSIRRAWGQIMATVRAATVAYANLFADPTQIADEVPHTEVTCRACLRLWCLTCEVASLTKTNQLVRCPTCAAVYG